MRAHKRAHVLHIDVCALDICSCTCSMKPLTNWQKADRLKTMYHKVNLNGFSIYFVCSSSSLLTQIL